MSIHKSLVLAGRLKQHRNVLTRAERLQVLLKEGRWTEDASIFGIPKVRNMKVKTRAKVKEKEKKVEEIPTVAGTDTKLQPAASGATDLKKSPSTSGGTKKEPSKKAEKAEKK